VSVGAGQPIQFVSGVLKSNQTNQEEYWPISYFHDDDSISGLRFPYGSMLEGVDSGTLKCEHLCNSWVRYRCLIANCFGREVNDTFRASAMMGECLAGRLKVNFVVKVLRVIVTMCPVRRVHGFCARLVW
jgi:hypothetical protein